MIHLTIEMFYMSLFPKYFLDDFSFLFLSMSLRYLLLLCYYNILISTVTVPLAMSVSSMLCKAKGRLSAVEVPTYLWLSDYFCVKSDFICHDLFTGSVRTAICLLGTI